MKPLPQLDLDSLPTFQCPGLTSALATVFVEASTVCLAHNMHRQKTVLFVEGNNPCRFEISWPEPNTQVRNSHNDLQEATERGATCVALHLTRELLNLHVVQRSRKGGGFDYWLCPIADPSDLFQHTTRLEVSGILSGESATVKARVKEKFEQTKQSSGTPCLVVVVEFSKPLAHLSQ